MHRSTGTLILTLLAWAAISPPASGQSPLPFPAYAAADPVVEPAAPDAADQPHPGPRRITPANDSAVNRPLSPPDGKTAARLGSPWLTLVVLAGIIAAAVVAVRLWRRHAPHGVHGIPAEALEMLGRRAIDRRQSLLLVRCGSRILLLGSSEAGLRCLAEISDPAEVDYVAGACRRRDADGTFSQSLSTFFQRSRPASAPAEPRPERRRPAPAEPAWKQAHA